MNCWWNFGMIDYHKWRFNWFGNNFLSFNLDVKVHLYEFHHIYNIIILSMAMHSINESSSCKLRPGVIFTNAIMASSLYESWICKSHGQVRLPWRWKINQWDVNWSRFLQWRSYLECFSVKGHCVTWNGRTQSYNFFTIRLLFW